MRRRGYRILLAGLLLMIALLLAGMVYIGSLILKEEAPEVPPAPATTPALLTSRDFEPDRSVLFTAAEGTLTDETGEAVKLSSLRGRPTVLVFWSSWCEDCKAYLQHDFLPAAQSARSRGAAAHLPLP